MIKKIAPVCEPSLTDGTPWSVILLSKPTWILGYNLYESSFFFRVSGFFSFQTALTVFLACILQFIC